MFVRFLATSGRSDFSIALIVGYGLRPSRQRPGHDWRGRRWRSPGSRAKGFCACQGLRRRGVGMCLAISTLAVLPSVGRKTSAPRTCLTPLNTSPAPSPVNASRLPSRTTRASLGASAVRYSFTVTDFHRLPFAGLPAHPSTHPLIENGRGTSPFAPAWPWTRRRPGVSGIQLAATCGAGVGLCREGNRCGFTRVACSAGHAGVSANSQLTLRVDHSMNPGQCCGEHRYWRSLS